MDIFSSYRIGQTEYFYLLLWRYPCIIAKTLSDVLNGRLAFICGNCFLYKAVKMGLSPRESAKRLPCTVYTAIFLICGIHLLPAHLLFSLTKGFC